MKCFKTNKHSNYLFPTDHLTFGESLLSHLFYADYIVIILGIHMMYLIHIMCRLCQARAGEAGSTRASHLPLLIQPSLSPSSDFNTQPHNPKGHALRRKVSTGVMWTMAHLPLCVFVLLFGVSIKKVFYINTTLHEGKISFQSFLLMALPCMLVFWTIEFIKLTHTGFFGCIPASKRHTDSSVEEAMEHREIKIGMRATSFRFVCSAIPFIWCLASCVPDGSESSHEAHHLLNDGDGGDSMSPDALKEVLSQECRPFLFKLTEKSTGTDPWGLVAIVWLVCVANVWSFQYETHLRSRTRNQTVLIGQALEDHKRAKWPSLIDNETAATSSTVGQRELATTAPGTSSEHSVAT